MTCMNYEGTKFYAVQGIQKGVLGGPFSTDIILDDGIVISISQNVKREIKITSNFKMKSEEFIFIFQNIENLLMLFDGRFYAVEKLTFTNDNDEIMDILSEYNKNRLSCFWSTDFCQYSWLKLISFQDICTNDLYKNWLALIDDLDIAFQMFLYALSDNKMTVDLNFAFLVELAEPFVEFLKERTYYCQSLTPGERRTTLKMCIDNIVVLYGADIFEQELNDNYQLFLDKVVKSRVRIMHIKKNQKDYFSWESCVKYSLKFSLLYRVILLSLLGVPYQRYKEKVQSAAQHIDNLFTIEVD